MANKPKLTVLQDPEEVAHAAADRFVELAAAAISDLGRFTVTLAGGSTPKRTYEILASEDYCNRIDWPKVHIFFGDERCVPPDDPQSNFRMAQEALLAHVPLPGVNIHRMRGEIDPLEAARLYETELRSIFIGSNWPRLDLVFLGMGDDGHTASLFPGTAALDEHERWVVENHVEKLNTFRITLTAPAINHAAYVAFLVNGTGKAERLPQILNGPRYPHQLPSQLIQPVDGTLEWIVDQAAVARL